MMQLIRIAARYRNPAAVSRDLVDRGQWEPDHPYCNRAVNVGGTPYGRQVAEDLRAAVQRVTGETLTVADAFARFAMFGATMGGHVDYDGLDWALSIPVKGGESWPIEILESGVWARRSIPIGYGLVFNAGHTQHRRPVALKDAGALQLFCHYKRRP